MIRSTLRRSRTLRRLRRFYWRARFETLRRLSPSWKRGAPDGLPVPPEDLRGLVSGVSHYSVPEFLEMGRLCADVIAQTLRDHGRELDTLEALLDFGCGCGRTIRHFAHLRRTRLHGSDYNPRLVGWCRRELPFAEFGLNRLEPPLPHAAGSFDLVYAFSVFTHLPRDLQRPWMDELARVLRPGGGYLAFSTLPESVLPTLFPTDHEAVRARLERGELIDLQADLAGTNECGAFHSYAYVRDRLAPGFDILEFRPAAVGQDFWLLRKRAA